MGGTLQATYREGERCYDSLAILAGEIAHRRPTIRAPPRSVAASMEVYREQGRETSAQPGNVHFILPST